MRECGDCTLCCTVLEVPEFQKRPMNCCSHCDKGCSIYHNRPTSCRNFECLWLQGDLSEAMRPDKVHFCLEKLPNVPVILASIEPGWSHTLGVNTDELISYYIDKGYSVVGTNGAVLLMEDHSVDDIWEYIKQSAKELGYNGCSNLYN